MRFPYKKFYEEYYGIEIPSGFDIHHIDGNRENNNIENLLMLPSDLHHRYHLTKQFVQGYDAGINLECCFGYKEKMALRFFQSLQEIAIWVSRKNQMDEELRAEKWQTQKDTIG